MSSEGERARILGVAAELGQEFSATAAELDRSGLFPHANLARLHEAGLTGLVTARRYGGQEAGLSLAVWVVNAISRGEPSTGLILAQQYLFHATLRGNPAWPETLRERVSVSAVREGGLANNFRVEPELGTPVRGGMPETTARRVPGGWSISGRKSFSTGAPGLAWYAIWARTDEPEPRVGTFLVPRGTPGVEIVPTWDHLGMRASGSHDTVLREVFVPEDHAVDIRPPAGWLERDPVFPAWAALLFSTIYDGVARAARDWFLTFLHSRVPSNLGAALATLPRMQECVGEIDALLQTNALLLSLAERVDQGQPPPAHEVFLAKFTLNRNAIAAVEKAVAQIGNPALARANPLERHLRDVLCARVHSPQADSALTGAGRVALGLSAV